MRSFTLAMHVPPHDKTLENHITFPKESENTTLSTCKHCCLNRECAEYMIYMYYYQCIETSHRPRFKSKLSRTRQKKTGKQTYTDYVVLAIWAIGGQNFGRPVVKMVANATGRVLILLPACTCTVRSYTAGTDDPLSAPVLSELQTSNLISTSLLLPSCRAGKWQHGLLYHR